MCRILQKAHALVGEVKENNCGSQDTAGPDDLHIKDICNPDQQENQYLTADAPEPHFSGEGLVVDGTHHTRDVVDDHKGNKGIKRAIAATEKVAEPSSDSGENKLNRVPELFHSVCPP